MAAERPCLERHQRLVLHHVERERGADVAHVRQRGELADQRLEAGEVRRHAFQDEVDVAGERPALAHRRPALDARLEAGKLRLPLRRELDHREEHHLVAEHLRVEQRPVAPDVAGLLERPHPAQARRRRETDATRELHIRDAGVVLELAQDGKVDRIEASAHENFSRKRSRLGRRDD